MFHYGFAASLRGPYYDIINNWWRAYGQWDTVVIDYNPTGSPVAHDTITEHDVRAVQVALSKMTIADPVYRQYQMTMGRGDVIRQRFVTISEALVIEAVSSPALLNVNESIESIDAKIELFFKNFHNVNMDKVLNGRSNVIMETIMFVKYYIRAKRQQQAEWNHMAFCDARVL